MLARFSIKGNNITKAVYGLSSLRPFSSSIITSNNTLTRYRHDAPERDLVNFPPPRVTENPGKVRMGFIPNEWFEFLYEKTGVTGPYVIFWGSIATILSKEMYVYWVDSLEHLIFLGGVIGITKLAGPKIKQYLDVEVEKEEKALRDSFGANLKQIDDQFLAIAAERNLVEVNKLIHDAKRENVELQLEASYRQRLIQVHNETKKRLDYHLAIHNVLQRVEKQQMLNFILNETNKAIGVAQEKEVFQTCLSQLKSLSQKHANTI